MKSIKDTATLHNGVEMPWLGFGVYKVKEGEQIETAIHTALEAGYRSIDTASLYYNEVGVGTAVNASSIPREELFITTKVWNSDQGYEPTLKAFEESRKKLNLDYIDLYLIHWAVADKYLDTWRALEKLYKEGSVRAIGVSNFQIHHLKEVLSICDVKPMVNQVEYHPMLTQKELHSYCIGENIQLEAWSPLARGQILNSPTVLKLAKKYNKTASQIVLRWDLQNEVITIPKSVTESRIYENAQIFDFELSKTDMENISDLNENRRVGQDPDNFNF